MAIQEPAEPGSGSTPSTGDGVESPGSTGPGRRERAGFWVTVLSVWSWFAFGLCVLVWVPLVAVTYVVTYPFDRGRYWPGYLYRKMPVAHQMLNPLWRFRVTGDLPADPRNPYVVVSNHESFADILLISHLPWEMKWLSKKEMFRIPVAGWLMYLAGDIQVDRGDRESAQKAMAACADYLRNRVSVMIFPEGTRAVDGELGQFKDGAFRLAIETQVPILPLAVAGTKEALRKHDWRFGRADAEVHVMAPVPTEGLTMDDLDELRERVRDLISAQLATMKST
jgi:1-acyl-sn-glycerol-3-phosphate acyltransferase